MTPEQLREWADDIESGRWPVDGVEVANLLRAHAAALEAEAALAECKERLAIEKANGKHWSDAYSEWVKTDKAARRLIELGDRLAESERKCERLKAERDTHVSVTERLKVALRMRGTGSYVEWAEYCRNAVDRAERAEAALAEAERKGAAKQAEIDRLMLEFCPGEMTPEQLAEWGWHQRAEFKEG